MTEPQQSRPQITPTDILQGQYEMLQALHTDLTIQNKQLLKALSDLNMTFEQQLLGVKIQDFNMPFFALVGLLIKITLAYIPAALILGTMLAFLWVFLAVGIIGLTS